MPVTEPQTAAAWVDQGNALLVAHQNEAALACYEKALALDPRHLSALCNSGVALRKMRRHEQALACYQRALAVKPDYADLLSNCGNLLRDLERLEQALSLHQRAHALAPNDVMSLNNCGIVLQDLRRFDEAQACYERARLLKPHDANTLWNDSLCQLTLGNFKQGWERLEQWRWADCAGQAERFPPAQRWLGGTALHNKTILLVYQEKKHMGFGDTLHFCRYTGLLAQMGARVLLQVQEPLKPLLQSLEGVSQIFGPEQDLPTFDYYCPLITLPLALQTDLSNIPAAPYLKSLASKVQAWQSRLPVKEKSKRIGLVWNGSQTANSDHNRSIALQAFQTLLDERADYFCLQNAIRPGDQATLSQAKNIHYVGDHLHDFCDTAALIELMDLVITVDTSVAHLAAAMGKPTWILLGYTPDWRWMLEGMTSPWYPSVRLFRQPQLSDWARVVAEVKTALREAL